MMAQPAKRRRTAAAPGQPRSRSKKLPLTAAAKRSTSPTPTYKLESPRKEEPAPAAARAPAKPAALSDREASPPEAGPQAGVSLLLRRAARWRAPTRCTQGEAPPSPVFGEPPQPLPPQPLPAVKSPGPLHDPTSLTQPEDDEHEAGESKPVSPGDVPSPPVRWTAPRSSCGG
jgi:hypothetical protein